MILPRVLKTHEYWLRLSALIYFFLAEIYTDILHRVCKLPTNPSALYKVFHKKQAQIIKHSLKRDKITKHQFDLIYPESKEVDIRKFDLTTFLFVVRHFTKLKPRGGWVLVNKLQRGDKSKCALLIELEHYYKENLESTEPIMFHRFEEDWTELSHIMKYLKRDVKTVQGLKKCQISRTYVPKEYTGAIMKAQFEFIRCNQKENAADIYELQLRDENKEHWLDISDLSKQNKKIEELVMMLEGYVEKKEKSWKYVYEQLVEIDKLLIDLRNDIEFLKEITIIHTHETVHQWDNEKEFRRMSRKSPSRQTSTSHSERVDGINDENKASNSKNNSMKDLDVETRLHIGTKRLKATYAYSFRKEQHMSDNNCYRQPYTKLQMLCKHVEAGFAHEYKLADDERNIPYTEIKVDDIEHLFKQSNHVLLRGMKGTGKTYLVRELVTEWIHGQIYQEIHFLFVLSYEEMEGQQYNTLEEALCAFYPQVFEMVTFKEIISKPNQVLLIFDGWGNVSGRKTANNHNFIDVVAMEFLNGSQIVLQKTMITMRVNSDILLQEFLESLDLTIIDIIGFNDESINNYVGQYFANQNYLLRKTKRKMKKNEDFRYTFFIPANLYAFCFIQQNDLIEQAFTTLTELYLAKLISLLHDWHNDISENNEHSSSMCVHPLIISSIIEAASLSYEKEMMQGDRTSRFGEYNMQDFLTAVYLFMTNATPLTIKQDYRLQHCLPFVSGLHGIAESSKTTFATNFTKALFVCHNQDFVNQLFLTYIQPHKGTVDQTTDDDLKIFLQAYFEFQGPLIHNNEFQNIKLNIKLHNMYPSDVNNLIHFLNQESYQLTIQHLDLHAHEPLTEKQTEEIAAQLWSTPSIKLDLKFLSHSSSVLMQMFQTYASKRDSSSKLRKLELIETNFYEHVQKVALEFILYLPAIHLCINTTQASSLMCSLGSVVTRSSNNGINAQLTHLRLSVLMSEHELSSIIPTLLKGLLNLEVMEIMFLNHNQDEACSSYSSDSTITRSTTIDFSILVHALTTVLQDNATESNLRRFKITNSTGNYEFLLSKAPKKITVVVDNDDEPFVDIKVMTV